jgi:hypothetical protein
VVAEVITLTGAALAKKDIHMTKLQRIMVDSVTQKLHSFA